jgi:mRNA interferase MazF
MPKSLVASISFSTGRRSSCGTTGSIAASFSTTVIIAITSNLRVGAMPGNVRLRRGEAGFLRASVVSVSQVRTVDRARLVERIGTLGASRMRDVLKGLVLLLGTDEVVEG